MYLSLFSNGMRKKTDGKMLTCPQGEKKTGLLDLGRAAKITKAVFPLL
jgi:hypothetical protein